MKHNLKICHKVTTLLNIFSISIMFIFCLFLFLQNASAVEWYKDENHQDKTGNSYDLQCPAGQEHTWHNCFGETVISDSEDSPYVGQYVGHFKNGKPHGMGVLTEPGGDKYIGHFKNGRPDGIGGVTDADGARLIGEYDEDGKVKSWIGHGYWSESGRKFFGEYVDIENGRGNGLIIYPDGSKYVGELFSAEPHGQGVMTLDDGHKYVGEFSDGQRHGQGTYFWPEGNKYVGEFKDGKQHGLGAFYFNDNDLGQLKGAVYRGENYEGAFHGYGSLTFPNGDQYIGSFEKNSIKGPGKYIYIDGRIIEDTFEEGDILRLNRASNHNKVDQNDIKGEEEPTEYSF